MQGVYARKLFQNFIQPGDQVRTEQLALAILPTFLTLATLWAVYLVMIRFPVSYIQVIGEDKFGEYTTAIGCGLAAAMFGYAALKQPGLLSVTTGLVALACLFVAGEEMSWGQRILRFDTPELIEGVNLQGEATMHNIEGLDSAPFHEVAGAGMLGLALFSAFPGLLGRLSGMVPLASRVFWPVFAISGVSIILLLQFTPLVKSDEVGELMLGLAIVTWASDLFARTAGWSVLRTYLGSLALVTVLAAALNVAVGSPEHALVWRYEMLALRDYPMYGLYDQSAEILDFLYAAGHINEDPRQLQAELFIDGGVLP
jgi:hypothetical protein